MKIKITFHNMEHSKPLEAHAKNKLERIHELLLSDDHHPPFYINLWLKANKLHPHHAVELNLKTSQLDLQAHDEGTDMYEVLDKAIDKMATLIRKAKSKQKDKNQKSDTEKKDFAEDKYNL